MPCCNTKLPEKESVCCDEEDIHLFETMEVKNVFGLRRLIWLFMIHENPLLASQHVLTDLGLCLGGCQGPVYSVAVSPLDNVVASGSKDKTVRLWLPTVCVHLPPLSHPK